MTRYWRNSARRTAGLTSGALALIILGLTLVVHAGSGQIGPFLVNTTSAVFTPPDPRSFQGKPSVATLPNGNIVICFHMYDTNPALQEYNGCRVFDPSGTAITNEFKNTADYTSSGTYWTNPGVVVGLDNTHFALIYPKADGNTGFSWSIAGRVLTWSGVTITEGSEVVLVNEPTTVDNQDLSVASLGNNNFVLTYSHDVSATPGNNYISANVEGMTFHGDPTTSTLSVITGATQLGSHTAVGLNPTSVAANGTAVSVAWSQNLSGGGTNVYGYSFNVDATGHIPSLALGDIVLDTGLNFFQNQAILTSGNILVLYSTGSQTLIGKIYGPGFSGSPTPFQVNTVVNVYTPQLARAQALLGGGFIIAWSPPVSATQSDLHARLYDSSNNPRTDEFTVEAVSNNDLFDLQMIRRPAAGGFALTWAQTVHAANNQDIYASIYTNIGPTSAGGPANLAAILEDSASPAGQTITSLVGSAANFDDQDGQSLAGVAVRANTSTAAQGKWQFWNGTSWVDIATTVSDTNATLLPASALVRFLPAANVNGSASGLGTLGVRLWDGTGAFTAPVTGTTGVNISGAIFDASTSTTATNTLGNPFSFGINQIGQPVTAVNDAPVVATGSVSLTAINEDTAAPAGQTVAAVATSAFSDATDNQVANGGSSANTLAGIAITGNAETTQGVWQYFNGASFVGVGTAMSDTSALVVAQGTLIRFLPALNFNGAAPVLTARLIDNSGGAVTSGTTINVSGNGGITPYSSGTFTIGETINPVNDVPSFVKGANQTVLEDAPALTVNGWATSLSAGPPDESAQTLNFIVSNNNNGLFSSQPAINASGNLTFTPAANANGSAVVTVQIHDSGGTANGGVDTSAAQTFTVTVTPVNDAPQGVTATKTMLEDGAYTFAAADFGFSDPIDAANASGANALLNVIVTTLPAAGTLTLSSAPVIVGQVVPVASLSSLAFTPVANANGTGYASFTFQVQDDGGTANGGVDTDQSPNTLTFNVSSVNDAPSGANKSITIDEDVAYSFAAADFGFTDPVDAAAGAANSLSAVKITTTPAAGTLKDNGVTVTLGDLISVADLNAHKLVFTPAANANGPNYASFLFQVRDDGGTANGGVDLDPTPRSFTVNVTPVNDPPSGTDKPVTTLEDTAYVFTAADFGFSDPVEGNAFLAVKVTTLPGAGALRLSDTPVSASDFIPVTAINGGLLTFVPAANATVSTSFTFQVQDDGGTLNGGVDLDLSPNTLTVLITSVNDAPSGTATTVTATEDAVYTFAAANLGFTDPNDNPVPNNLQAVIVTSLPAAGTLTNHALPVIVGQVISASDLTSGALQFSAPADDNGTPYTTFTFQVRDDGGTANGGVDLDPSPKTLTIDVAPVNDPPSFTGGPDQVINEDAGPQSVPGWATNLSTGPPNESGQTLTFNVSVTGTTGSLAFTSAPVIDPTGTLTFTHDQTTSGTATVSVTVSDSGGNTPPSSNTSPAQTFTITVNACGVNPVVTTNADSGAGSLRQALSDSCVGNTITFDMNPAHPAHVVSPITLTSGPLSPVHEVTIAGPGAGLLTIGAGGSSRVFTIDAPLAVSISGLTLADGSDPVTGGIVFNGGLLTLTGVRLTNGQALLGGGVYNDGNNAFATLTIADSLVDANSAFRGGGIYYTGANGYVSTLVITNSTISGNAATENGGGLFVTSTTLDFTTLTITNATITGNHTGNDDSGNGQGGGMNLRFTPTVLKNTIVAKNVQGSGAGLRSDDNFGVVRPESAANLIGDGYGTTGITDGTNGNQIGTTGSPIDPRLGPLADNGGPTWTHALLPGSPAIDAGDNTAASDAGLTADQRRAGFTRVADGPDADAIATVDIGAFEAQPTIEDIADQSTLEDHLLEFPFNVGDATVGFDSIVATSSDQAIVPDANLLVDGTGSSRTLHLLPATNASGTATITVTASKTLGGTLLTASDTFVLTVTALNDAPTIDVISAPAAIDEDAGQQTVNMTGIGAGGGESQTLTVVATSDNHALIPDPAVTYVSPGATGSLAYTPVANSSGTATITVTVHDDGGTADGGVDTTVLTFVVTVNPVADTPTVTDATTGEDTLSASGLVVTKNPADGAEVGFVKITNIVNGTLFKQDGITPVPANQFIPFADAAAGLRFKGTANFFGTASFDLQASTAGNDAGLGGAVVTATITITPVAEPPNVTNATTLAQVQTTSGLVITPNAPDGPEVTHFKITGIQHGLLFRHDGTTPINDGDFIALADGAAGLAFTPADGFAGAATFLVQGATDGTGSGLGSATTATITVSPHASTTALVSANPNPSDRTEPIPVVYTVVSADGGPVPTGTVTVSISGGSETCTGTVAAGQCTLTPTISGGRSITATYNGDEITTGSASSTLAHMVNVCTANPIVTNTADGPVGSLRDAISSACFGTTITFNIAGPGPHTIDAFTNGTLFISKDVTITGSADGVRIDGNHANRLFQVDPGVTLNLNRLSLVGGTSTTGGAILNSGTLAITESTLQDNTGTFGGAIFNQGVLTIANTTMSGNHASSAGGAIVNHSAGTLTLTHVTITANTATTSGGGVVSDGTATIGNSIIAGNTAPAATDLGGNATPTLTGANLLSGNPMLGPLQDNGGPAFTHMPLPGSPAIDAGDNIVTSAAGLTTDQRGAGFARVRDGADADTTQTADIGAVEADPSIEVLTDKATNEDAPVQFVFNVGDATTAFDSISASSSNTTLLANASAVVTGAGSTRTLTLTPTANQSGTTVVTVTATKTIAGVAQASSSSFTLTVNAVNDPPTLDPIANPAAIPEDSPLQTINLTGISAGGGEIQSVAVTATSSNTALIPNPTVSYTNPNASGSLAYTPAANKSGTATITVTVTDAQSATVVQTFVVTVSSVADTPSVTNASTSEDTQTTSGLVIAPNAADGAEVTHFKITAISGGTLFQNNGTTPIAPNSFITVAQGGAGLRFTPSPNSIVTGHFTAQASIGASNAGLGGGLVTADITVASVPDAPTVTPATTAEDTQTTSGLVITRNAADGPEVAYFQIMTVLHGTVYLHDGTTALHIGSVITTAEGAAGLRFTPDPDFFGDATVIVMGQLDTTSGFKPYPFGFGTITVAPVADTPSITSAATLVNTQTTSGLVVGRNPADGSEVTHVRVTAISGGSLFKHDGVSPIAAGAFVTLAEGAAGLRFTPAANSQATGHVTIQASTSATVAGLGGGTVTADITVTCPVMTLSPASLPAAVLGVGYSQTFTQSGGLGTIAFSQTGALPAGLSFTAATATLSGIPLAPGSFAFDVTATPANGCGAVTKSYTLLVGGGRTILTGADEGGASQVRRFTALDGTDPTSGPTSFLAFEALFNGGARVAEGDVNGDGKPDFIAGSGPGRPAEVRVFDGTSGALIRTMTMFEPGFIGGVYVAAGDVDGDGFADIIAASGPGRAGEVRVYSGRTGALLRDVNVFVGGFTGGVRVAAGDVTGDGLAEVIVGTGPGASEVAVLSSVDLSVLRTLTPYPGFVGGVFVAAGDVNGDGFADVVTGADAGGSPLVRAFDGPTGTPILALMAFDPAFTGGVRVAVGDVTGDGHGEIIAGRGPGLSADVRVFDAVTLAQLSAVSPYPVGFTGGVFVATAVPLSRMIIDAPTSVGSVRSNFTIVGWAFEEGGTGAGIAGIDAVALPVGGGAAITLGAATLGDARPDVATAYGAQYGTTGFHLAATGLAPGTYDLRLTARGAISGQANLTRTVRITVRPDPVPLLSIDVPTGGPVAGGDVVLAGWALTPETVSPPGVDAVHVWAAPVTGGAWQFAGAAVLGLPRPDVAAAFGSQYATAGYALTITGLPPGTWDLHVYPRETGKASFAADRVVRVTVPGGPARSITTGADMGGGPHVRRFSALDGSVPAVGALSSFFAFDPSFSGGVRVAEGDLNGDGVPDYIVGAGPGSAPTVRVFDGASGTMRASFTAFEPTFTGGVFVAAGDVNGDGYADVIVGSGQGRAGEIKVWSGRDLTLYADMTVFDPAFTGGVRVAAGDVNGDGLADVIAGSGPGIPATVTVFNGATASALRSFIAYSGFAGGVFVAAGDVNGDGFADIVTGAGEGGGPLVRVFDGKTNADVIAFYAFGASFTGGVRVAAGDVTGDGRADIIAGSGSGGGEVRVFDGSTATLLNTMTPYSGFTGGVFVATAVPVSRMSIDLPALNATVAQPFLLGGWAFEEGPTDAGIDAIHVWAMPVGGGAPIFAGVATLGGARPDVALVYGAQYAHAGYSVTLSGLPPGTYDLMVFAHGTKSGTFNLTRVVRVKVGS